VTSVAVIGLGRVGLPLALSFADRGLDASAGVLFVIGGGKALAKAIRVTFGGKALIQRCRRHKERNILDHLPEAERPLTQRRLRAAWALDDASAAERKLNSIARSLAKQRPGAAASLREGLTETVTVNRLGVTGSLLTTLDSTNPAQRLLGQNSIGAQQVPKDTEQDEHQGDDDEGRSDDERLDASRGARLGEVGPQKASYEPRAPQTQERGKP